MMNDFMKLSLKQDYIGDGDGIFAELKKLRRRVKDLTHVAEYQDGMIKYLVEELDKMTESANATIELNDELLQQLDEAYKTIDQLKGSNATLLNADPEDIKHFWFDPAGNPHPKVHTDQDYDDFDHEPTLEISKDEGIQLKNLGKLKLPSKVSFSTGKKGFRIRLE